jgi:FkbM family methyltransferase
MFEPDPQNILLCEQTIAKSLDHTPVILHKVALSETTGLTDFYTVDQETYNNPGVAGLYQLDFSNRPARDPDRGRGSVNKLTRVQAFRFDELGLPSPDLLFMDVEGAELNVLRGFGSMLSEVKAIVLESSFWNTYRGGGSTFPEVSAYLEEHGFNFVSSNNRGRTAGKFPMARKTRSYLGQYEAAFDSLWMRM